MKKNIIIIGIILISVSCTLNNQDTWKIADNPINTIWASDVDPSEPWMSYPRPDLVRKDWLNLNGLWEYSIGSKDSEPRIWEGSILVPYPVESALSGVKRRVSDTAGIWYKKSFSIPSSWRNKHILLNFEASDWETVVWIDGKKVGMHRGGYDPFTFDITEFLSEKKNHDLLVSVWDPTNKGTQPRGKQVNAPGGIWYTPSTGIWQTVWIEPVNESYISSIRTVTDVDNSSITIEADVVNPGTSSISITLKKDGETIDEQNSKSDQKISFKIKDPVLWSPENPFLYDLSIELKQGNKTIDEVSSYTGIRKISLGKTSDGFTRVLLNNKFVWQNGPLDQGFWPDGLYTPPTEEAMVYDIEMTLKMGFNMLRKHVKVENRIFYYWCDKLGILVWQDMPSGDRHIGRTGPDIQKSEESAKQFEFELKRMIETKFNHPSIIMWVPFNEGWGQFETGRITDLIFEFDPTRLVNSASGWTDRGTGSVNDVHNYPEPISPAPEEKRAIVLGEFGGLGLPLQGHTWEQKNWGYRNMEDTLQLLSKYEAYYDQVHRLVNDLGLSATVYTQTTDVETETNGLMTYDRKINKMGVKNVFNANHNFIPPVIVNPVNIFFDEYTVEFRSSRPGGKVYYTTDNSIPDEKSTEYKGAFKLKQTATIRAFTIWEDTRSRINTYTIEKRDLLPSQIPGKLVPGLRASVYYGEFALLPDFSSLKPDQVKIAPRVQYTIAGKESLIGIVFDGYIKIPEDGIYGLFINSDDGSKMTLDDTEVVLNDGIHGMTEEGGYYPLQKGLHKLKIEYFQALGGVGLEFIVQPPGKQKIPVPASWLFN